MSIFDNKLATFYKSVVVEKGKPLPYPGKHIPILDLLTNERYTNHNLLAQLRQSGYKSDFYKKNKKYLSAACFSSVQDDLIYSRSDLNHLYHTGFLSFDIDADTNPLLLHGSDDEIWQTITNMPYVAYAARSVSNIGFWGLVPIQFHDEHGSHYEALRNYFAAHNIHIDHTSDVSRLRFLAYDPDAHFELNPEVFTETAQQQSYITNLNEYERKNLSDEFFRAACIWVEFKYDLKFEQGMVHNYLLRLYAILRNARVSRASALNWIYNNLIDEDKITTNCLDEIKVFSKF